LSVDPSELRRRSAEHWEEAAAGWERRQEGMRSFGAPVSQWLVQAIHPQPGHRVLELAAGIGETGFMAAELIAPGGRLTSTDQVEGMVAAARRRAEELGLVEGGAVGRRPASRAHRASQSEGGAVEFKVMDAEWIDFPVASFDAVLCRWGYMLMADPQAALGEARRVLRPGGRIALAVWDALEHNPWMQLPGAVLAAHGAMPGPEPGAPGPFALADPDRLRAMLEEAGFADVEVDRVAVVQSHPDFDGFWEATLDVSRVFHDAVMSRPDAEIAEIREQLRERLAQFAGPDGKLEIPGRTLVAAADA
jgi:SAM-dependent methyltransferase